MIRPIVFLFMYALYFLAFQIEFFVVRWHVTETTGDFVWGATLSMLHLAPVVVAGPVAGYLASHMNRRSLTVCAYFASAVALIALWLALKWNIVIELLTVVVLISGLANAFSQTALQSVLRLSSGRMQVSRFVLVTSFIVDASFFYAPLAIDIAHRFDVTLISLVLWAGVITALFAVYVGVATPQTPRIERTDTKQTNFNVRSFVAPERNFLIMIALIGLLLRPIFPLIPMMPVARGDLGLTEVTQILTSVGLGTVIMSLVLVVRGKSRNVLLWIGLAMGLAGGTVILATALPFSANSLIAWGAYGACCSVLFGLPRAWIQENTPEDRIAAVGGASFYLSRGGLLFGLPVIGVLSDLWDLVAAMQVFSAMLIAAGLPVLFWATQRIKAVG